MLNSEHKQIKVFSSRSSVASSSPILSHTLPQPVNSNKNYIIMSGTQSEIKCPSEYVKLNIGGSLHYTTISTLRKHDTMLRAMFSGRMEVLTDSEGKKLQ